MRFYVARHGETEGNRNELVIGHTNEPLNETGRRQSEEIAKRLSLIRFQGIYTSPLIRARETAECILERQFKPCELIVDNRLVEQDYGFLEGISWYDSDYVFCKESLVARFPHGESYLDIAARVYPFLRETIKKYDKYDNILIVTHGNPARIIETFFDSHLSEEAFRTLQFKNCEYRIYETGKGNYR